MTQSPKLEFLDWNRPPLDATVDYLLKRYRHDGLVDLSRVIVVVPGSRAGRLLAQVLVDRMQAESLAFVPPTIETVGQFPEHLYESKLPFATDLVQQLAWLRVLRALDAPTLQRVVPHPPTADRFEEWLDVARVIWRLHRELAAEGMNFEQVAKRLPREADRLERLRWETLHEVQTRYLRLLDSLELWDLQTARLFAIEHELCSTGRDIILLAAVDLNRAVRDMLDQVAGQVTALVLSPDDAASRFDKHGCLIPSAWAELPLDLATEQIRVANGPGEQAAEVVRSLGDLNGKYRTDEIVIGVPDERLVPHLQRQLAECGVRTRWLVGKTLGETGPFRFLAAAVSYLNNQRPRDFAAIVRHPDVWTFLQQQGLNSHWLADLDAYFCDHLPMQLDASAAPDSVQAGLEKIDQLLTPLREPARRLAEWTEPISQVLLALYGSQTVSNDDPSSRYIWQACESLREALLGLSGVPREVDERLTASQAIEILISPLLGVALAAPTDESAIELLGWLELPLDPSPAVIVTTFNEGFVPSSLNADLFLPNSLRGDLGLLDNARRYARDAYSTSLLLATRKQITLIAGRRDVEGNPLIPSRLLFATAPETVASRAKLLFAEPKQLVPLPSRFAIQRERSAFVVPKPVPLSSPLKQINVTAFRTYLACPFRFYLRHVLQLEAVEAATDEMNAAGFGTLAHHVLSQFGTSDFNRSTVAKEVFEFLAQCLSQGADDQFGTVRLPAIEIQILQLRQRLQHFAEWQASRAKGGWEIRYVEEGKFDPQPALQIGNKSLKLTGRIDRIDFHPQTKTWQILDYKTGDSGSTPEKTHRRNKQWIDLQLPLYLRLAESLGLKGEIQLGYILLPKDAPSENPAIAEWDPDTLADAHRQALEVARRILDQNFWPPADRPPAFFEEFAGICQDATFERTLES